MRSLAKWWRRWREPRPTITQVRYYPGHADLPERVPTDTLAVVGTREAPKWLVLQCPCRRGHQLTLSLSRQHRPNWRLRQDAGGPSLTPSIDVESSHHCHFWLRNGRVYWVRGRLPRLRSASD